MKHKLSVVIEKDEDGYYAWCPALKGCQSEGETFEEALANIREAAELYMESLSDDERNTSHDVNIFTTAIEVEIA